MEKFKTQFSDFDEYNEAIKDWYLDIKLLSKKDFNVSIDYFSNENFSLCREALYGKIEYKGIGTKGSRIIAIPRNYNSTIFWFDKKISGNNMLIFPKDNFFDALTYSFFDNYTIAIEENLLMKTLNDLGYTHAIELFDGKTQELFISKGFSKIFAFLSEELLGNPNTETKEHNAQIKNIIYFLLKYMEYSKPNNDKTPQKRIITLNDTLDIINGNPEQLFTIPELCSIMGVSERTLEYTFKEKFNVTPNQYIKATRLNNVKKDLYLYRDNKISIADIAGKYNFWHMGQFAKDFKAQFGYLPSKV